jgi:hypothetical protein
LTGSAAANLRMPTETMFALGARSVVVSFESDDEQVALSPSRWHVSL